MASHTPRETTAWVAGNLKKAQDVTSVEVLSDQVLRVSRASLDPFVAGVVSAERVEVDTVRGLVNSEFEVEIIANVPRESYWTGGAIRLAHSNDIATGAYGDLLRVIGRPDVRGFRPSETVFLERGLSQHDRVLGFERVHDRLYRISRGTLPDLTVVMLNEYELTADHLRAARDRYGPFSVAVITNPNGSSTGSAEGVAGNMGVEILKWGPFLGRLNRQ